MRQLTRITITLPEDHSPDEADRLSALLALHVPHGWAEESLPDGRLALTVHSPSAGFCTELEALLGFAAPGLPGMSVHRDSVPEEDWTQSWKEFFTPVAAGGTFLVLAPWMEEERAATGRIPILIEPKTAFGTGHHATTALCLEAVAGLYERGRLRGDMRFLDLGTGSGILGIGCALLGLKGLGLDTDQAAVENALENRALNLVSPESFPVARGSADAAQGPFDLVLANILAGPLKDLAGDIVALFGGPAAFAPDAKGEKAPVLILSGLLDIQARDVEDVYTQLGLPKPARLTRGEWVALIFA